MTAAMQIAPRIRPSQILLVAGLVLILLPASLLVGCVSHPLNTIIVTPGSGVTTLTGKGQQVQFTATGQYGSSKHLQTTQDISASAIWKSSILSVATINASGVATAVGDGTTMITASMKGGQGMVLGSSDVTVHNTGTGSVHEA